MTDAGRAAIERAKADGSWTILEPVEDLIVPDDLAAAFEARPGARDLWEDLTASAQRTYLLWIYTAKREVTRVKRVAVTAERVAAGLRHE